MSQLLMHRPTLDHLPEPPALLPNYELRLYRPGDASALAQVLGRAFDDPDWTADRINRALIDAADVAQTLVIACQGLPVATASAQLLPQQFPGSGCVHWVAVDPGHQGARLGYAVSLAVLHVFVGLGCRDAVLFTDDHRLAAIKTYLALGFVPRMADESHPARWSAVESQLGVRSGLC